MSETKPPGSVCAGWWHQVLGNDDGAARRARARLRRCGTPVEALGIEEVHELDERLRAAGHRRPGAARLALVAIMLSHASENGSCRLAEAFGRRRSKNSPRALGEARFQTLIRTTDRTDLIDPMRRAMAIVRRTPIDVAALAGDLYRWNENVRRKWCFQYFGASAAAPERISEEIEA